MPPVDWHRMWYPELNLLEVVVRASLVYIAAHVLLRLAGRKESSFNVAVLFLISVALRGTITLDDASLTTGFVG